LDILDYFLERFFSKEATRFDHELILVVVNDTLATFLPYRFALVIKQIIVILVVIVFSLTLSLHIRLVNNIRIVSLFGFWLLLFVLFKEVFA
jgi:hypothetical protein